MLCPLKSIAFWQQQKLANCFGLPGSGKTKRERMSETERERDQRILITIFYF